MLKLIAVVVAGLALGVLTTVAFACNDAVNDTSQPLVQAPPTDTEG
jgi:hypothetical protein